MSGCSSVIVFRATIRPAICWCAVAIVASILCGLGIAKPYSEALDELLITMAKRLGLRPEASVANSWVIGALILVDEAMISVSIASTVPVATEVA